MISSRIGLLTTICGVLLFARAGFVRPNVLPNTSRLHSWEAVQAFSPA